MRVSHEAIYQSLYVQGRGALRRELTACLRTGRALRAPRDEGVKGVRRTTLTDQLLISERPAEVDDRAVPGHWEGDLILGTRASAIGAVGSAQAGSRCFCISRRYEGHNSPRVKDGPPVTGAGAGAVRNAIAETITTLPEQLRRSLTWGTGDRDGPARAVAARYRSADLLLRSAKPVAARDEQGHTNGLLRQYFPRGTDLARHSVGVRRCRGGIER